MSPVTALVRPEVRIAGAARFDEEPPDAEVVVVTFTGRYDSPEPIEKL